MPQKRLFADCWSLIILHHGGQSLVFSIKQCLKCSCFSLRQWYQQGNRREGEGGRTMSVLPLCAVARVSIPGPCPHPWPMSASLGPVSIPGPCPHPWSMSASLEGLLAMQNLRLHAEPLNQNLPSNKTPGQSLCMLKLEKHNSSG
uniref:Uncharacterized protein n=1 Tax=Rousettus aegyptiacus TaxID=9407 RepID=A0A7J8D768_ROUAE|nr:hypothetical protein HJG63_008884 [Rousettus aegyptiacus]